MPTSVDQLAAEALAQRRAAWSPYHAVSNLEALEALRLCISDTAQQDTLDAYMARRRRFMKGTFEVIEKLGETRERFAVAGAAAIAVAAQWLGRVPLTLSAIDRMVVEASLYGVAVTVWAYWFTRGRTAITMARRHLAELGKAD